MEETQIELLLAGLLEQQNKVASELLNSIEGLRAELRVQQGQLEQIRYSVAIEMQHEYHQKITRNQLSILETVEDISKNKKSLARFGDGELGLAAHPYRNISFQRGSHELTRSLQNVLSEQRDGLLVAMPATVIDVYWMTSFARYWSILRDAIPNDRKWGIANVSRANAFKVEGKKLLNAWRECWDQREITIVTGKGSRFYDPPEFFSNAKSIDYVYGSPKHAFEHLSAVKQQLASKTRDLVLIALGPAGTVLAAELHDQGIQALDVGHLTASYDEAFNGGPKPESLPVIRENS